MVSAGMSSHEEVSSHSAVWSSCSARIRIRIRIRIFIYPQPLHGKMFIHA
jgi:hypothetical protein